MLPPVKMASNSGTETESVLVVSDDDAVTAGCEYNLSKCMDARVDTATNVGEAVDILSRHDGIGCIVSDHALPDTDGVALHEVIRAQFPALPFILAPDPFLRRTSLVVYP